MLLKLNIVSKISSLKTGFFISLIHILYLLFVIEVPPQYFLTLKINFIDNSFEVGYKTNSYAGVAQLVERDLAKVEVAGSSPVTRFFKFVM